MELSPSEAAAKARIDARIAARKAEQDAFDKAHRAYVDSLTEAQGGNQEFPVRAGRKRRKAPGKPGASSCPG